MLKNNAMGVSVATVGRWPINAPSVRDLSASLASASEWDLSRFERAWDPCQEGGSLQAGGSLPICCLLVLSDLETQALRRRTLWTSLAPASIGV